MCKNDFIYNLGQKEKFIICPICNHSHNVYEISTVLTNLKKALKKLVKKFYTYNYYLRVEFEQDYKLYESTDPYFKDAIELFTKYGTNRESPPRFDIVAYRFVGSMDYSFLLHDSSINPEIYDTEPRYSVSATFNATLENPHWRVYPEDLKQAEVTLFDFANLACMTKLYSSYYQLLSKKKGIFFYPLQLVE
jgi:hypothetical protein